jgi:hypothetical protein
LEQAVQHLAAHAARRFGFRDQVLLSEGMAAPSNRGFMAKVMKRVLSEVRQTSGT